MIFIFWFRFLYSYYYDYNNKMLLYIMVKKLNREKIILYLRAYLQSIQSNQNPQFELYSDSELLKCIQLYKLNYNHLI